MQGQSQLVTSNSLNPIKARSNHLTKRSKSLTKTKEMRKKEIRQSILGRYIRLLVNNNYEFESILGQSLLNIDYKKVYNQMQKFTVRDYDFLSQEEKTELELLINKL